MTNDILRLRDALVRNSEFSQLRQELTRDLDKLRQSLKESGEYRILTRKGALIIRSVEEGKQHAKH